MSNQQLTKPVPIFYSVSGNMAKPVPSTGMFSSMGKQSTASSESEAQKKADSARAANKIQIPPGFKSWDVAVVPEGMVVIYHQSYGGKHNKSRRGFKKSRSGRKTRRNKSRRSRSK
jgi:hypothetical protein